ncbi:MAG: hypothetical protein IJB89_10015 [Akkermansia sp.]|nr:hypothetical protein [Akkermansia sp.]
MPPGAGSLDEVVGGEPTAAQATKKDAPVGHRGGHGGRSVCPRRADKNPRPPPGPGDAGVNGAEVSAPPGSEKPTGLFSLIRAAWGRVT